MEKIRNQEKTETLESLSGLMEVRLRAHWGSYSGEGRVDAGCNKK